MYGTNSSSTSHFSKTNRRKKEGKDDNGWKSLDLLSKRGEKDIGWLKTNWKKNNNKHRRRRHGPPLAVVFYKKGKKKKKKLHHGVVAVSCVALPAEVLLTPF